ncbi:MAG: Mu-like prophage major head subunit gpT family protein [Phycisphaerales bacterium]|nr:Mu-like prophage major head subunit gpT family protein [Phycisphaerales bacterium]
MSHHRMILASAVAAHPTSPSQPAPSSPHKTLELTAQAEFEIEGAGGGEGAGGAAAPLPRFRMVAYSGGPMKVAGWRHPVVIDLAGLAIPSPSRPIRFGHDATAGVGHTDQVSVDEGRLVATGMISRDTPAAREVVVSARNGFPWQASVGASVEGFEFLRENQTATVNGREVAGPLNIVRKSTLGEISFVDLGADGSTSATIAAGGSSPQSPDLSPQETGAGGPASEASSAVAAMRAQVAAESERIAAVRRLCAGQHAEIEARAIRDGWDATRTELEVLRASRPKAPAIHAPAAPAMNQRVLEAACVLSGRLSSPERHCAEQDLEAATRAFGQSIGLQELLLHAAWANGYTGRTFRDWHGVMDAAFGRPPHGIDASNSTLSIGGILSNVANKFLLEGFFSVERTWRNITAVRSVTDFKAVTSYRLTGNDQYERVAPGGEIKHGTLGEETYTNRAETYGLMLSIDRTDIINDDLGAITTVPRKLGAGSGKTINDIFWKAFLANGGFFTAGNKNYLAGADTALSIDGLTKAEVAFMDQVDSDGKPLGVMPQVLLVPTALSALGSQLFKSMELRDNTSSAKYPVTNPHQGKFRVEVSRYLGNAAYPGSSSKAWYMLASPADLPVIEVAFLNGQEAPTIETAEQSFNRLGIQMRGYHDFGVALQDPRGGVKSKGEA